MRITDRYLSITRMNKEQADLELIERFLSGSMSRQELMDFETRCEEDREFARKLRLRKSFPSLFHAEGKDMIDVNAPAEKPEPEIPEHKERKLKPAYFVITAAILFVAASLAWFFLGRTNQDKRTAEVDRPEATRPAQQKVAKPAVARPVQADKGIAAPAPSTPAAAAPATTGPALSAQINPPVTEQKQIPTPPPPAKTSLPIQLVSPADKAVFERGSDLVFRWTMQTDSFTNFYIISESNEKLAWWRGIRPGVRELSIPGVNFKAGTFYWYVGTKANRRTLVIK